MLLLYTQAISYYGFDLDFGIPTPHLMHCGAVFEHSLDIPKGIIQFTYAFN